MACACLSLRVTPRYFQPAATISKFAKKINSISIGHGAIRVTSDFIHKNTNPKIAGNIP